MYPTFLQCCCHFVEFLRVFISSQNTKHIPYTLHFFNVYHFGRRCCCSVPMLHQHCLVSVNQRCSVYIPLCSMAYEWFLFQLHVQYSVLNAQCTKHIRIVKDDESVPQCHSASCVVNSGPASAAERRRWRKRASARTYPRHYVSLWWRRRRKRCALVAPETLVINPA